MYVCKKTYETPCTNHDNHVSYVQKCSPIQISSFLNSPCEFQLPRKFNRFEKRHSNMAVHCSPAFEPKEARKKNADLKTLITGCMCVRNNIDIVRVVFIAAAGVFVVLAVVVAYVLYLQEIQHTSNRHMVHEVLAIIFCSEYVFSNILIYHKTIYLDPSPCAGWHHHCRSVPPIGQDSALQCDQGWEEVDWASFNGYRNMKSQHIWSVTSCSRWVHLGSIA